MVTWLDEPSFSIDDSSQRSTFPGGLLDPGWSLVLFYVLAGLSSGEGSWYGGNPSSLWPKSEHMKEGGREGAVGGGLGRIPRRSLGEGQGLALSQWRRAHIPFEDFFSDIRP